MSAGADMLTVVEAILAECAADPAAGAPDLAAALGGVAIVVESAAAGPAQPASDLRTVGTGLDICDLLADAPDGPHAGGMPDLADLLAALPAAAAPQQPPAQAAAAALDPALAAAAITPQSIASVGDVIAILYDDDNLDLPPI